MTVTGPRAALPENVPRIRKMKIDPSYCGAIIGQQGKTITSIIEDTGVDNIDLSRAEGIVSITAKTDEALDKAFARIESIISEIEGKQPRGPRPEVVIGRIYNGEVKSVMPFGIFVELLPGLDGAHSPHPSPILHPSTPILIFPFPIPYLLPPVPLTPKPPTIYLIPPTNNTKNNNGARKSPSPPYPLTPHKRHQQNNDNTPSSARWRSGINETNLFKAIHDITHTGFCHISELSDSFIRKVEEVGLSAGDKVDVMVTSKNEKGQYRVKRMTPAAIAAAAAAAAGGGQGEAAKPEADAADGAPASRPPALRTGGDRRGGGGGGGARAPPRAAQEGARVQTSEAVEEASLSAALTGLAEPTE
ncbi:hypothetical protein T492DRAFT_89059 [Pavlovales sp. CCMP2436]|nr:hypothetical protein T492DRAFT_89059 [Pavlovales sp. CCMP2436]